jgi:hypothetical protein
VRRSIKDKRSKPRLDPDQSSGLPLDQEWLLGKGRRYGPHHNNHDRLAAGADCLGAGDAEAVGLGFEIRNPSQSGFWIDEPDRRLFGATRLAKAAEKAQFSKGRQALAPTTRATRRTTH